MVKSKKTAPSDKLILTAQVREVLGKKVKKLRREGIIPANIFGQKFASRALSINLKDFTKAYRRAGETGIIYVAFGKEEVPALIRNVQFHPVHDFILHVDLRKVDLTQKVEAEVPIKIVGVSTAVTQKAGVLLTLSPHVKVEALPANIPHEIEVDISALTELGQEIKVSGLKKVGTFEIKDPQDHVVVSVVEHKEESVTPETTAPVTVVTTAVPVEGEAVAEEGAKTAVPAGKTESAKPGAPAGKPTAATAKSPAPKPTEGKK